MSSSCLKLCGGPNYLEEALAAVSGKQINPGCKEIVPASCLSNELGQMEYELRNVRRKLECVRQEQNKMLRKPEIGQISDCDRRECSQCPPCPAPCNPNKSPTAADEEVARLNLEIEKLRECVIKKNADVENWRFEMEKSKEESEIENTKRLEAEKGLNEVETKLQGVHLQYLEAQHVVEEQGRQLKNIDMDNSKVREQINIELQKVKLKFQDKFQELVAVPEMLRLTKLQLEEAQRLQMESERFVERLALEVHACRDKLNEAPVCRVNNMNDTVNEANKKLDEIEGQMKTITTFVEKDGDQTAYKCTIK